MEENENTDQLLTNYFAKAKAEVVVMTIEEVESIISAHIENEMGQQFVLARYKYWLMGGLLLLLGVVGFEVNSILENNNNLITKKEIKLSPVTPPPQKEIAKSIVQSDNNIKSEVENKSNQEVAKSQNPSSENIKSKAITPEPVSKLAKDNDFHYQGTATINFEYDHKKVNLTIGDKVKKLVIDGAEIDENDYSKYTSIIEKGVSLRKDTAKSADKNSNAETNEKEDNRKIMEGLFKQLVADKLVDENGHFEFRLTGTQMLIDNMEQNETIFNKYKKLFENISGIPLNAKSNIRIRH